MPPVMGQKENGSSSPDGGVRRSGVADILIARGRGSKAELLPKGSPLGGGDIPPNLLLASAGFSVDSNFGQFVLMRYAEAVTENELTGLVRRRMKHEEESKPITGEPVANLRELLKDIRAVRKEIGEEIFGDKVNIYEREVYRQLFFGLIGRSRAVRVKRQALYKAFGDDIRTRFPLTSS